VANERERLELFGVFANSCLLSVFGIVLVVTTVYDVLTTLLLRRLKHYSALPSSVADEHNGISEQTPIFGTADDVPLIPNPPSYHSKCSRVVHIPGTVVYVLSVS